MTSLIFAAALLLAPLQDERLQELVEQLGAEDPDERDEAAAEIEAMLDGPTVEALEKIAGDLDPGPQKRLRSIIEKWRRARAGRIVFVRRAADFEGRRKIWTMDADGRNAGPLAEIGDNASPAFSPDGTSVVFLWDGSDENTSTPGETMHLVRVELKGGRRTVLTKKRRSLFAPAFAPDGKSIYAIGNRIGAKPGLLRFDLESRKAEEVGKPSSLHGLPDSRIAVDPAGKFVLFEASEKEGHGLYRMPLSGGDARRIVSRFGTVRAVAISRDGKRIAIAANGDLWLADPEGKDLQRLTKGDEDERTPSFSPDGRRLVFWRPGKGIFSLDLETKKEIRLGDGESPCWGPAEKTD